jgi:hypothetical protein
VVLCSFAIRAADTHLIWSNPAEIIAPTQNVAFNILIAAEQHIS